MNVAHNLTLISIYLDDRSNNEIVFASIALSQNVLRLDYSKHSRLLQQPFYMVEGLINSEVFGCKVLTKSNNVETSYFRKL